MNTRNLNFRGNKKLLDNFTTAFFCSRNCPDIVMPKLYDWAAVQEDKERCIISGFHSEIERKLLHVWLETDQPAIMVMARSLYKRIPSPELKRGLEDDNLLLVSPFGKNRNRVTAQTARKRNELMVELADELMVAFADPGGSVSKLVSHMRSSRKLLYTFDIPQNEHLLSQGFYAV